MSGAPEVYICDMRLRLASYNIRKCLGLDRRRDPGRIVAVLNALGADIVALQEVDLRLGARPAALGRAYVEAGTGLAALPVALPGRPSLGWHGQTFLVRPDITVHGIRRIELPGLEPRGAVLAELETRAGPICVVGVHLGLIRRYRLLQMRAIRAALTRHSGIPTAIIGDFNEWSAHGGMTPLIDAFHVHAPGLSFHASRPVASLDRIALGRGLNLVDAGVLDTPLARVASDHLPVWADIRTDG